MDPDAAEIRVLGCLIEKQRTTPDHYPLSLNALRAACNQSTNRDPVVAYDEHTVREAAQRLGRRRWSRLASGQGSRTPKYRHLLDEALTVGDDEMAILCVLMLRGPQTPGELKGRCERMHRFGSLEEVDHALQKLIGRGHARRLHRRPGQKEDRFAQTLGGSETEDADPGVPGDVSVVAGAPLASTSDHAEPSAVPTDPPAPNPAIAELRAELAGVREELVALRAEVATLREALGG